MLQSEQFSLPNLLDTELNQLWPKFYLNERGKYSHVEYFSTEKLTSAVLQCISPDKLPGQTEEVDPT
jgi:hypothetical protein